MSDCQKLEPLLTPYVDGEAQPRERSAVDAHLSACAPCASRVAAERAVRTLLQARRATLAGDRASATLRAACTAAAARAARRTTPAGRLSTGWRHRVMPLALAASLT